MVGLVRRCDLLGRVRLLDLHTQAETVFQRAPQLDRETLLQAVHLISLEGDVRTGFGAVRRLAWIVPLLWPALPALYTPGSSLAGPGVQVWVSRNRHRILACGPGDTCATRTSQSP